jgi:hypothetical protein
MTSALAAGACASSQIRNAAADRILFRVLTMAFRVLVAVSLGSAPSMRRRLQSYSAGLLHACAGDARPDANRQVFRAGVGNAG